MHTQKNRLQQQTGTGYASRAPHKAGAGFRSLLTSKAHNRASGFFVRTVLPRLFRTRIMAGRTGPTSVGPGSLLAGTANLVRLATHSFAALDGEFLKLTSKEATPWQTANSAALLRSITTSAPKSTNAFSAHHALHASCTSTCCMNAEGHYRTPISPPFSAIWRTISPSCNASLTSTDKHPEAILRPFAGGFHTSVVGRIAP
ncbi:TPA: ash family protein [Escherichia coli]|nr:ash family protein [Escherichia coli]